MTWHLEQFLEKLAWKMSELIHTHIDSIVDNYRVLQACSKLSFCQNTYAKDFLATLFTIRCQVFAIALLTVKVACKRTFSFALKQLGNT